GSCGELLISGPGLVAFERAITLEVARGGEVGPEGFRWLRKAAGLKAVRLAELLDVTPMQVSRWENGRNPLERRAVALVSALALEQTGGKTAARAVIVPEGAIQTGKRGRPMAPLPSASVGEPRAHHRARRRPCRR